MYNHVFLVTAEGPDGTEIDFDIEAVDQEDCIKKCKMMLGHDVMVTYIEDEGVDDDDDTAVYAEDSETPIDAGLEDTPDETSEGIPETYGDVESFTPDIDVTEV